jgi:hypothetical protein
MFCPPRDLRAVQTQDVYVDREGQTRMTW